MENNVITIHKADLAAGEKKMKGLQPQTPEWWEVKHKMSKYEIAYSQALNVAVEQCKDKPSEAIPVWHLEFYKTLTEPYRLHRDTFRDGSKKVKAEKGYVNIDSEITMDEEGKII